MAFPSSCFALLWFCFQSAEQVPASLPEPAPAEATAEEPADEPDPASFSETLVVTGARAPQPISDALAPTTVLSREDLARGPDLTLDDRLRQVPGFGLLRRSSSLTAHPTSQGVSLRGLGPSGASRTLVLLDGSPLNDPFGGWVAWNRLPVSALESVEVARGALSQLYGSAALGGAIQLLPRSPHPETLEVAARGGDHSTGDLEVFASDTHGGGQGRPWGWSLAGRRFVTEGFHLLAPADRGAVDRPAGVDFSSLYGRLEAGRAHLA
ncbi:MAG TPA: TonB-dependent receptor plug domain-containing protein, partial [Thermoanaerobaculia bacterium]|nr:TonB-dependent receptor plug domain-containing protein [Thermoanaerobaculia bacterium]